MQLKSIPEDFIVVEIATHTVKEEGPYALFEMTKRNLSTERAITMFSDALGIPRKHVGYAGNKDSRAVTRQHISIKIESPDTLTRLKAYDKPPMLLLRFLGFIRDPLGLGMLEKNRFEIVARAIATEEARPLIAIPNYFDEQRFSVANARIGKFLVQKEYGAAARLIMETDEHAEARIRNVLDERPNDAITALRLLPKNQVLIYVHAYQSLLWNEVLTKYILHLDSAATHIDGAVPITVPSKDLPQARIPIFGFGTESEPLFGQWYEEILAREGLVPRDFVDRSLSFLTVEGGGRDAFFTIEALDIGPLEEDELHPGAKKQRLSFILPKSCYATMVTKCLYRVGNLRGEQKEA